MTAGLNNASKKELKISRRLLSKGTFSGEIHCMISDQKGTKWHKNADDHDSKPTGLSLKTYGGAATVLPATTTRDNARQSGDADGNSGDKRDERRLIASDP